MKQYARICNTAVVAVLAAGGLMAAGAGPAAAAAVPTVSVTGSGAADWQITFDRGDAAGAARCVVWVGGRPAAEPKSAATSPKSVAPRLRTTVLPGRAVAPGRHAVRVRCGRSVSPTVWLHAPRNQLNDIGTWLSNSAAGLVGS